MRSKGALILSVLLGLMAVVMMSIYMNTRETQLLELSNVKDVLVATRDIGANVVLDEQMVRRIQVPSRYAQPTVTADMREVVGRVTAVAVPQGAQLLGTYLLDSEGTGLAFEVPRGQRAITVAVSDITGVSGLVRPGNFVDVLGTFEFGRPIGVQNGRMQYADERTEARVLLQNVQVVAVEREHRRERPVPTAAKSGGALLAGPADAGPHEVKNVTFLVGPREAQELVLAQHIGALTLALRSTLDAGQLEDLGMLDPFGLLKVSVPIKTRARPAWQEIRGGGLPQ